MKFNLKTLLLFLLILLFFFLFFYFDLDTFFTLKNIKLHLNEWKYLYQERPILIIFLFIIIYTFACFGIPITIPLMLIAGAIFGKILGTIICIFSATLGGGIAFLCTRYLCQLWMHKKYGHYLYKIEDQLMKSPFLYVFSLRISGMVPHFIANVLFGISHIPFKTFIMASILGMSPIIFIYVQSGSTLMSLQNTGDILTGKTLGSFALLACLFLISILYKHFKSKHKN